LLESIEDAKMDSSSDSEDDGAPLSDNADASYSVRANFVEIYNEKVYDLLAPLQSQGENLRVREHPKTGPYVEGAQVKDVSSWTEMKAILEYGSKARRTAATNMNVESSRSHAIFTLEFRQTIYKKAAESDCEDEDEVSCCCCC